MMQAQVNYDSEVKIAAFGERTITIKNLTPVLPPKERETRKREMNSAFLTYSASTPTGGGDSRSSASLLKGAGRGII